MKNLNVNQMEILSGGVNQRNCGILGLVIVGSAIAGFVSGGGGWLVTLGAVGAAASADCF